MSTQLTKPHGNLKLTPERQERIVQLIRDGNYNYVAAQAVGIHPTTFYLWLNNAEEAIERGEENEFTKFYYEIKKAEAEEESEAVPVIRKLSLEKKDPYALMMFESRRHRARWSESKGTEGGGNTYNLTYIEKQENKSLIDAGEKLRGLLKVGSELETPESQSEGYLLQEGSDAIE